MARLAAAHQAGETLPDLYPDGDAVTEPAFPAAFGDAGRERGCPRAVDAAAGAADPEDGRQPQRALESGAGVDGAGHGFRNGFLPGGNTASISGDFFLGGSFMNKDPTI